MVQTINVTVPIPETHVLITKEEHKELVNNSLDPIWSLEELKQKMKISSDETIKKKLLFRPKFMKIFKEKGIVHYPNEDYNRWHINARKMSDFIDEHFEEIHRKE